MLDVKIFRELATDKEAYSLQFDIRKSYGNISMKLGVDEDTVRNRIDKFRNLTHSEVRRKFVRVFVESLQTVKIHVTSLGRSDDR